jgi:hypothetical protein
MKMMIITKVTTKIITIMIPGGVRPGLGPVVALPAAGP